MDALLEPTDTQAALRHSLQRWLADNAAFERRSRLLASPDSLTPFWRGLADDLGLLGAALPDAVGGLGGGLADQLLICQALGEALMPEPYTSTAVLGAALLQALQTAPDGADGQAGEAGGSGVGGARSTGTAAAEAAVAHHRPAAAGSAVAIATLLRGVADGTVRLAVAATEPGGRADLAQLASRVAPSASGWRLTGRKALVRAAPWATHWLVSARDPAGQMRIALIEPALALANPASGCQQRSLRLSDGAWAAELAFDDTPITQLVGAGDATAALDLAFDLAMTATGAEALGVMQRLMRDTLAHVRQRRQFGQPLASFQVLQHRLADMHMALLQAGAAVGACADLADDEPASRARRASSAHVAVLTAARVVGQGAVQLHGGMGMTDELAIGHGFKRLTVIEQQFGGLHPHLARVARLSACRSH